MVKRDAPEEATSDIQARALLLSRSVVSAGVHLAVYHTLILI